MLRSSAKLARMVPETDCLLDRISWLADYRMGWMVAE